MEVGVSYEALPTAVPQSWLYQQSLTQEREKRSLREACPGAALLGASFKSSKWFFSSLDLISHRSPSTGQKCLSPSSWCSITSRVFPWWLQPTKDGCEIQKASPLFLYHFCTSLVLNLIVTEENEISWFDHQTEGSPPKEVSVRCSLPIGVGCVCVCVAVGSCLIVSLMSLLRWGPLCLKPWNGVFELPKWPLVLYIARESLLWEMKQLSGLIGENRGEEASGLKNNKVLQINSKLCWAPHPLPTIPIPDGMLINV